MTGDQPDVLKRLKAVLPPWFGSVTPVLDGVLTGFAYTGSFLYSLYAYAKKQTRILTSIDGWLDMVAGDFFGTALTRAQGQTDASFLTRIRANLFREKGTRNAIIRVLQDLTGRTPLVFESERPLDTGAWNNAATIEYGGFPTITIIGTPLIFVNDWEGNQLQYTTPRTNLCFPSEDFTTNWFTVGCTVTPNTAAGPNGVVSADTILQTGANGSDSRLQYNLTVPNNSLPYTDSIHIKKTVGATVFAGVTAQLIGGTPLSGTAVINTNTGAITASAGTATFQVTDAGTYWRIGVVNLVNNASGNINQVMQFYPGWNNNGTITKNTINGAVNIVFGGQMEQSAVMTSYIGPTVGAGVTVTDYTISGSGLVTWSQAPLAAAVETWTGSYSANGSTVNVANSQFGIGDGVTTVVQILPPAIGGAGRYGSLIMPFEALVQAYRAAGSGIPYVNGYGQPAGGYNIASRSEYASLADIQGAITDADIYAAVNSVRPVATTMWTSIQS